MKAGPATPRGGGRALALRLLLWLGLAVALLAALALGVELLQPPPEAESSRDLSLGGFGGAARAALVGAALAQLLAAVPLLVGLRRRDARWAMLGLTLVGTLAAAVPVLFLVDARDPPSCPEGTLGGFAAPSGDDTSAETTAPTAADSVGLAMPARMEPTMTMGMSSVGEASAMVRARSRSVFFSLRG